MRSSIATVAGIVVGVTLAALALGCNTAPGADATQPRGAAAADDTSQELKWLRAQVPSQSHTMMDVGYQWTNLWFAGEQQNWALAEFYFNEARQHILWTIRIRPIRKDAEQRDVDLQAIFTAVDSTLFAAVKVALLQKDREAFVKTYTASLDGCYSCHKASSKPFLRPIVPKQPAQSIIDFAPAGDGAREH